MSFFWELLLQHVPWRLLSDSLSRRESHRVCEGVNRAQISADVWSLNQSVKCELASPWPFAQCGRSFFSWSKNVAMMEDGQTNDPRDESRTGGNPFIRCQRSSEEDGESVEWQLGNGPFWCSLLILWESSEEQSRDASFGSPSTQTGLRECHSSVFQTWSFSIQEL